jgi:signal transduction histidine kinase
MDIHKGSLSAKQLKWESLRAVNILIICSIIFFLLITLTQTNQLFKYPIIFNANHFLSILILLLCATTLYTLYRNNYLLTQRIIPITCAAITLYITINHHSQSQAMMINSFLYLFLLLPIFYSYLLAYNPTHLIINNALLMSCYIITSYMQENDSRVILFNSALLFIISCITLFIAYRELNREDEFNKKQAIQGQKKQDGIKLISKDNNDYLNKIIHDIRQPLSSLSLYSHLLEKKLAGSSYLQLAINIKHSSEYLESRIFSLLELARLDNNAFKPAISEFTLTSALLPSINEYQQKASKIGLKFITRLPEFAVKCDKRLLVSIIDALLSNAIVHGSQEKGATILLAARHHQNKILLQIWNQGDKIETSIFEHLFDEVAQVNNPQHNKNKGMGLGLAIAQRKAKLCGTKIQAASSNKGSRFSLLLPAVQHSIKQAEIKSKSKQMVNQKILLIDDDQSILNALRMLLESWGYSVDCAETAEIGLDKYQKTYYALVISDYRLPNQKTGLEVINKLNKITPAILLTGEADIGELNGHSHNSRYKVLNKPVKPAALKAILKTLI